MPSFEQHPGFPADRTGMNSYDETKHARDGGGRYAPKATSSADYVLEGEQPLPLSTLGLSPGERFEVPPDVHGDPTIERLEIIAQPDGGYTVEADTFYDLAEELGMDGADLTSRQPLVEAYFADRYGADLDNASDWDDQRVTVRAAMPQTARTDEVMDAIDNDPKIAALRRDDRDGFTDLKEHLQRRDGQLADARDGLADRLRQAAPGRSLSTQDSDRFNQEFYQWAARSGDDVDALGDYSLTGSIGGDYVEARTGGWPIPLAHGSSLPQREAQSQPLLHVRPDPDRPGRALLYPDQGVAR